MYLMEHGKEGMVYKDLLEKVEMTLPEGNFMDLVKIEEPSELKWPEDYRRALKNPAGSMPLSVMAIGAKKIAIVVSDATRGAPTAKLFPFVIEELKDAGIKEEQICVIVALGVHRPATAEEIAKIVGKDYVNKLTIMNHDAFDEEKLVYLGDTSHGTPVEVNKAVYDADLRITIGKVEPHEFAGFSGGRKSVLPGISSEKTIKINHRPEMLLNENAIPGVIDGNPISEDMLESAEMLGIHFTANFVLNANGNAVGVFCGDLREAHYNAIEFMKSFCEVTLYEKPDVIVTTPGYPLNIDFYQSVKPLIAMTPIMKENMVVVLYAACPDGVNSRDMLVPYEGTSCLEEVIQNLMKNYKIQMDHALLLCKIMQKKVRVVVCSPNVEPDTLKKIFMDSAATPQAALEMACKISGNPNPKVLFFPQPQRTLPVYGLDALCSGLLK